jgi:hypothetical protein
VSRRKRANLLCRGATLFCPDKQAFDEVLDGGAAAKLRFCYRAQWVIDPLMPICARAQQWRKKITRKICTFASALDVRHSHCGQQL